MTFRCLHARARAYACFVYWTRRLVLFRWHFGERARVCASVHLILLDFKLSLTTDSVTEDEQLLWKRLKVDKPASQDGATRLSSCPPSAGPETAGFFISLWLLFVCLFQSTLDGRLVLHTWFLFSAVIIRFVVVYTVISCAPSFAWIKGYFKFIDFHCFFLLLCCFKCCR